jgi:hypothetical protein
VLLALLVAFQAKDLLLVFDLVADVAFPFSLADSSPGMELSLLRCRTSFAAVLAGFALALAVVVCIAWETKAVAHKSKEDRARYEGKLACCAMQPQRIEFNTLMHRQHASHKRRGMRDGRLCVSR